MLAIAESDRSYASSFGTKIPEAFAVVLMFSDWKKGRYTPKIDKLCAIANYFEVPVTEFIEGSTWRG